LAVANALPIHEREEYLKEDRLYKVMVEDLVPLMEDQI
jgi:hypothetical protein